MKIIHLNLSYTQGISGGERCTVETIRYFAENGLNNIFLTTDAAKKTYVQLGLEDKARIQYQTIPSFGGVGSAVDILQAYIRRIIPACRLMANLQVEKDDIVICHDEFFPNTLTMQTLIRRCPAVRKVYWVHMIAPRLWHGYLGEFTGTFHWPGVRLIRYRLEQWLYRRTVPEDGVILSNNPWYRETLLQWFPKNRIRILSHYSGMDIPQLNVGKKYDLAWCGRFHGQKGLPELVDVVARIKSMKPDVTLALIGSGDRKIERQLKRLIAARGLEENIVRTGYLEGDEKFRTLQQARVFVMPSWFESFGQVNLEAMKCGLPVVAYDLPVYAVFRRGMVKVPVRDNARMADEILRLLDDSQAYEVQRAEALEFSAEFSWKKTGREILEIIEGI